MGSDRKRAAPQASPDRRQARADERDRKAHLRALAADDRERKADLRAGAADERDRKADLRADAADERDRKADLRADAADERDRKADLRADAADERDRKADIRALAADERDRKADIRALAADERDRELLSDSATARLQARLETMPVIEQAKGIVMGQEGCGPEEAFDLLRRASQRSNVPIRELAVLIVARSTGNGAGPTAVTIPLTTHDP